MKFIGGPYDGRDDYVIPHNENVVRVLEATLLSPFVDPQGLPESVPYKTHLYRRTEVMMYVGEVKS